MLLAGHMSRPVEMASRGVGVQHALHRDDKGQGRAKRGFGLIDIDDLRLSTVDVNGVITNQRYRMSLRLGIARVRVTGEPCQRLVHTGRCLRVMARGQKHGSK